MWNISSDEPFINNNLIDQVKEIKSFIENEEEKERIHNFFEDANTSEIARIFEHAQLNDILPVCCIAVRRFPAEYVTVLLDYILKREEN